MPRPVWLLDGPLPLANGVGPGGGAGAHRERLVGRQRRGARLLHRAPAATAAPSCGFFRSGSPSAGICTACSLDGVPHVYAELHALSNFSFSARRFASRRIGCAGQASGLSSTGAHRRMLARGVVRAHVAAKQMRSAADHRQRNSPAPMASSSWRWPRIGPATARLSRLISRARRASIKGRYCARSAAISRMPSMDA